MGIIFKNGRQLGVHGQRSYGSELCPQQHQDGPPPARCWAITGQDESISSGPPTAPARATQPAPPLPGKACLRAPGAGPVSSHPHEPLSEDPPTQSFGVTPAAPSQPRELQVRGNSGVVALFQDGSWEGCGMLRKAQVLEPRCTAQPGLLLT